MDKLELDGRVARLERRVGLLMTAAFLAVVGGVFVIYFARGGGGGGAMLDAPTAVAAPLPPPTPVVEWIAPTPEMFPPEHLTADAEGTMGALSRELATLKELRDEGVISEPEWQAKKAKVLEGPLDAGELRSDLERVQQLADDGAIGEGERAAIRAKLLGIEVQAGR